MTRGRAARCGAVSSVERRRVGQRLAALHETLSLRGHWAGRLHDESGAAHSARACLAGGFCSQRHAAAAAALRQSKRKRARRYGHRASHRKA